MLGVKGKNNKKRCPRCGGNIFLDIDEYGWFEHCLRCGHTKDLSITDHKPINTDEKNKVVFGGLK